MRRRRKCLVGHLKSWGLKVVQAPWQTDSSEGQVLTRASVAWQLRSYAATGISGTVYLFYLLHMYSSLLYVVLITQWVGGVQTSRPSAPYAAD